MRLIDSVTEDHADKRRQKSEHKGPAFTIVKLLPAGVVEQAKQMAARAIADLVGGAR